MMALSGVPHCEVGPDECFACKARYWRRHGAPGVHLQGGGLWSEMTNKQFADRELAMAAADGRELVPVDANGETYSGYSD